jgi:glycosyltransferase involved in cell wall biosynthesis
MRFHKDIAHVGWRHQQFNVRFASTKQRRPWLLCRLERAIIIALVCLALASVFGLESLICDLTGTPTRSILCRRRRDLPQQLQQAPSPHYRPSCSLGGNVTALAAAGFDAKHVCACIPPSPSRDNRALSSTSACSGTAETGSRERVLHNRAVRVAAVVPFYNGDSKKQSENEQLLAECIKSLKNQTVSWLTDVFVVIDGGGLATSDLGDEGNAAPPKQQQPSIVTVHTIKTPTHKGLPHARNAGVRAARTYSSVPFDYILFLDADDVAHPRTVELLARSAEATGVDLAWGDIHFFGDENVVWETQEFNPYDLMWANHPATMALVRASVFDRFGLYDESMTRGMEDWAFWARIAAMGAKGVRVPLPLFHYRRHGATLGVTMLAKREQVTRDVLRSNFELYAAPERLRELKRAHRLLLSVIVVVSSEGDDCEWNKPEFDRASDATSARTRRGVDEKEVEDDENQEEEEEDEEEEKGQEDLAIVEEDDGEKSDTEKEAAEAEKTIRSLATQSLEDFELVIVMDRACGGGGGGVGGARRRGRRRNDDDGAAAIINPTATNANPWLAAVRRACAEPTSCSFPVRTVMRTAAAVASSSSSSSPRNYGVLSARGDIVAFLEPGDVLIDPLALEKLALALAVQTDASIAAAYSSSKSGATATSVAATGAPFTGRRKWNPARLAFHENYVGSLFAVRKDAFVEVGGMDAACRGCQDYDFWLRFVQHGYAGAYVDEALYQKRTTTMHRTYFDAPSKAVKDQLRARNPVLYGQSCEQQKPLEHYRPLAKHQGSQSGSERPEDLSTVIGCLLRRHGMMMESSSSSSGSSSSFSSSSSSSSSSKRAPTENNGLFANSDASVDLSDEAVALLRRAHYRRPQHPFLYSVARHSATAKPSLIYMVPQMALGGAEIVDLNILQGLRQGGRHLQLHLTLIAESGNRTELADKFAQVCDEVVVLDLMPVPDRRLPELLDYFIVSRNAAVVFNRNSLYAYKSSKRWRRKFPQLKQVDLLHLYETPYGGWERESVPYHRYYDARFVISDSLRQHMEDKYELPAEDFTVIPNGLDYSAYDDRGSGGVLALEPGPRNGLARQQRSRSVVVGFVGRLEPQKRPLLWIRMAAALKKLVPSVKFVMVGTGSQESAARGLAARLIDEDGERGGDGGGDDEVEVEVEEEEVEFEEEETGVRAERPAIEFQPEPSPELFASLSVLVLTSAFEGVPLVMLEAAAAGVPTVAPDVGGIREVAGDLLGRVFPADAPATAIAASVAAFLQEGGHDDPDMRELRRLRVRSLFGLEAMQDAYGAQLTRLISTRDEARAREDYLYYLMDAPLFSA